MGTFEPPRPEMSPEEFRLIRDLVYDQCGIFIRDDMKFLLERRLWPRVESLGLSGYAAYHQHLRYDLRRKEELESAIEALTTHETYFFREPHQLGAFSRELLPALHRQNQSTRRLRLWSAGCSSGEEAYTIAILLEESGLFDRWQVEILGTDISRRVLAQARRGEYGQASLRSTPPTALARHFVPNGERFRIKDRIRANVTFSQLNLADREMTQMLPTMDAIFCRNVLIYFDTQAKKRVLKHFYDRLRPGGYLLLGHSESLITLSSDFELVHLETDLVYRRPESVP
jgi:chemotaxis protein methyltransferase CheR